MVEENKNKDKELLEAREEEIAQAIETTREEFDTAHSEFERVEQLRIKTYWETGTRVNALSEGLSKTARAALIKRFVDEVDTSKSFFSLATNFAAKFTKEQYEKCVEAGMDVRTMKALVSNGITHERRQELIKKVMTSGICPDEIREVQGVKGTRKAAAAKNRSKSAKTKPPKKVFTSTLDRATLLEEDIGIATDAIGRMTELEEASRVEATQTLVALRTKLDNMSKTVDSFLKFTKNFSKTTKKKEEQ